MRVEQFVIVVNFPNIGILFDGISNKIKEHFKDKDIEIIPPTTIGTFTRKMPECTCF